MKKILMIFTLIILCTMNIKVKAITNDSFYNGEYIYNIYIKKVKNNMTRYETARFLRRSSDLHFAYCLQPFVEFINGKINTAYDSDYEIVTNMTKQKWERISLLAYYGYGYQNHTEEKWYIITQMMIWKTVDPSDIYFTDTLNGNRISKFENEMQEIENLISKHYIKPSFNGLEGEIKLGEQIRLEDTNNILNKYKIIETSNMNASINGNEMIVEAITGGQAYVIMENRDIIYNNPPIVYIDDVNQDLLIVGSYEPIISKINFNILAGKIKITKIDSENLTTTAKGDATLVGAIYNVFNADGNIVSNLVINNEKTALTNYLPYGEYTIKEVKSSEGYNLDLTQYKAIISKNDIINIIVKEDVIKGRIQIKRYDENTNICKSSGESSLIGAIYGIYDSNNNLVEKLTINSVCTSQSKLLPYGKYTIKELQNSNGYIKNNNTYEVFIKENNLYELTFKEQVIKNDLEINKVIRNINTGNIEVEANAEFKIMNNDLELATIKTNEMGYARITLPYGHYKVYQVSGMENYDLVSPFDVNVSEYTEPLQTKYLKTNFIGSRIKLINIDNDTKLPIISLSKFKIKNKKTNEYICEKVDCDFETNNGFFTTSLPLPKGIYEIEQIKVSNGYLIKKEKIEFIIDENKIINDNEYGIMELKFENNPALGKIEIYTIGEKLNINNFMYENINLKDATFEIRASEDITINGYKFYNKNEIISIIKTDEFGYANIINLPLGKYSVKELVSTNGNIIDDSIYEIEINYKDEYTPIITITKNIYNYIPKGKLEIININSENNPISGTKINIYTEKDELIYSAITDEQGKIELENLFIGKFYIEEMKVKEEYKINRSKIYFEISKNELRTLKITNDKIKGKIKIYKVDQNSNPLDNTLIGIYDFNNNLIETKLSNEIGIIEFDLEYGNYYYKEIKAKEGYKLDDTIYPFQIKNEETLEYNLINNFDEQMNIESSKEFNEILDIEVPDTLNNKNYISDYLKLIVLLLGIYIYGKKNH